MTIEYGTEQEVIEALRSLYDAQAYAFLPSVANTTGAARSRTADLVVVGLWPSRGLEIEGFEIKVSRSDWLKELKSPGKSAPIQKFCDRWWVVAGKRDIVKKEELPKTWGLIQPHGQSMRRTVQAPQLEALDVSRGFVASIMRSAVMHEAPQATIKREREKARSEGYDAGYAHAEKHSRGNQANYRNLYERLQKRVDEFEEASGVSVGQAWAKQGSIAHNDPVRLGEAMRAVLIGDDDIENVLRRMERVRDSLKFLTEDVEKKLKQLKVDP